MNETSTPMTNDELLEMAANNRRRAAVNLAQWVDMAGWAVPAVELRAGFLRAAITGNELAAALERQVAVQQRFGS